MGAQRSICAIIVRTGLYVNTGTCARKIYAARPCRPKLESLRRSFTAAAPQHVSSCRTRRRRRRRRYNKPPLFARQIISLTRPPTDPSLAPLGHVGRVYFRVARRCGSVAIIADTRRRYTRWTEPNCTSFERFLSGRDSVVFSRVLRLVVVKVCCGKPDPCVVDFFQ